MATRARTVQGWVDTLPKRARKFQASFEKQVEKQVEKGYERALEMLPAPQRRNVKRFVADAERFGTRLQKRGDKLMAEVRKRVDEMGHEVTKRLEQAAKSVAHRLDLASRTDLNRLRKRIEQVERRVAARPAAVV